MARVLFENKQMNHLDRTWSSRSCESISLDSKSSLSLDMEPLTNSLSELVSDDEEETDSIQIFMNSTSEIFDTDLLADAIKDRHRIMINQAQCGPTTTHESISTLFDPSFDSPYEDLLEFRDLLELKQSSRVRHDKHSRKPITEKNSSPPIQGGFNSFTSPFDESMVNQYFPHGLSEKSMDSIQSIGHPSSVVKASFEKQVETKLIKSVYDVDVDIFKGRARQHATLLSVGSKQLIKHSAQSRRTSPSKRRISFLQRKNCSLHLAPKDRYYPGWRNASASECSSITEKSLFPPEMESEEECCRIHAFSKNIRSYCLMENNTFSASLCPLVNTTLIDHHYTSFFNLHKVASHEDGIPKLPKRCQSPCPNSKNAAGHHSQESLISCKACKSHINQSDKAAELLGKRCTV